MSSSSGVIKYGDYIVIQRQKYTKLHKFSNADSIATLGKEQVELKNIDGKEYFSTFKMIPKEGGKKRLNALEICTENEIKSTKEVLGIIESGVDNRNIQDDGASQALKSEDIHKLREEGTASSQILEKIVENSRTFTAKTEYAQEKYLRKKERKYFEYVQIRKPTIRLLSEIYYRQDPDKVMGIRVDSLSQILMYSGICAYGNYLLYESGTNGLLPAAFLDLIGSKTEAQLVHMHPGNVSQKQAVLAMGYPEEQNNRCISVNIYSVLREYFQGERCDNREDNESVSKKMNEENVKENLVISAEKLEEENNSSPPAKKARLDNEETEENMKMNENNIDQSPINLSNEGKQVPKWKQENEKAVKLMDEKFDALVIAPREYPSEIVKTLLPFLKPSRPLVIFNLSKEILMEIYVEFKASTEITGLHLTSNWMRLYQILPNRTHPEVGMSGNSGYILHGFKLGE